MPKLTAEVNRLFRRLGFQVTRYPGHNPVPQRVAMMRRAGVNLVIDVGANVGQYAKDIREHGYPGTILSVEPLADAYQELSEAASRDPHWLTWKGALGSSRHTAMLNVAGNSVSSSLLEMLPSHEGAAPGSRYVRSESVLVTTLDELLPEYCDDVTVSFLKVDTQGSERDVLSGATRTMEKLAGLQVEMSLSPLYAGQLLLPETIELAAQAGFDLVGLEPGFMDVSSGRLLQCDGVFFRPERLPAVGG